MYKRNPALKKVFKIKTKNDNLEYQKVLNKAYKELNRIDDEAVARSVSKNLINRIRELDPGQALFLATVPKPNKLQILGNFTLGSLASLTVRFGKAIRDLWTDVFKLGTKHSVTDIMVNSGLFNKEFGRLSNFSSIEGFSLEEGLGLAEFAKKNDDELTPQQRRTIGRARRLLTILKNNRDDLMESGAIYDYIDDYRGVTKSSRIAAKMSIEEKIGFLETIQEIENLINKAEASESRFLSSEYLDRRLRVLTNDYTKRQDNAIKSLVAEYLDQNVESVKQILNKNEDTQLLEDRLTLRFKLWRSDDLDKFTQKSDVKARKVLRTELSVAYNFGKLAGFTAEEDLDRKVQWVADWELEEGLANDYKVCKFCEDRHYESIEDPYTVRELLQIGTRLDSGVLGYRGTKPSRTDFKNPSLPMIPAHPNCSCYWVILPKEESDEQEDVTTTTIIPGRPSVQSAQSTNLPVYTDQASQPNNRLLSNVLGATLLVGGAFLLGRSNIWKSFSKAALGLADDALKAKSIPDLYTIYKVDDYISNGFGVPKYVSTNTGDITKRYRELLTETAQTPVSELDKLIAVP